MFRNAQRKKAKLRMGITGASNSGKTWSALEIAFGMTKGNKIFFVDTESGRGELYQGLSSKYDPSIVFDYQYCRLNAPFSPERYIEAIKTAEKEGCEVLIIDSLSHAWSGDGGILSIVEKAGKASFTDGWRIATPKQNLLIDTIICSNMHIICNMRSKVEYVLEPNDKGKMVPRKIGLAPIQKDQLEYEFTVFLMMGQDNYCYIAKDNTQSLEANCKPSPDLGRSLIKWLDSGFDENKIFNEQTVPVILERINNAQSVDELKEVYIGAHQEYFNKFPMEFKKITDIKDHKKLYLEEQNNLAISLGLD